jgi:hypothetical protein
MKTIRRKIEEEDKTDIYKGLKIALISFLIACSGFALHALFGLAIGRLIVYIGFAGAFIGFRVHVYLFFSSKKISEHNKSLERDTFSG